MPFAIALACAQTSFGQLTSDSVPRQRVVPRREEIQQDLDESRFHLGALRVRPLFALRDFGYNSNVFGSALNPVADWTATVSAGGRGTLPFGPKMYLRGIVLPEYTWYQKLSERRFFGGTYGGSAVALFNRLSIEATGTTAKTLTIVNSEIEVPAVRRMDDVNLDAEIEIFRRLSLFGTVEGQKLRFAEDGPLTSDLANIDKLNRNERLTRGGVRYRFRSSMSVAVAAEQTRSDFDVRPEERDNASDAVVLSVNYDRPRAYANVSIADRKGQATHGSAFPEYSTTTGSYFLSYSLVAPVELQAFGSRHVIYDVFATFPYYFETLNGGAIVLKPGTRFAARVFADTGKAEYTRPLQSFSSVIRNDDILTFGAGVAARLYRNMVATVIVSQSKYQSNFSVFDRSVLRIQTGISLTGGYR